MTGEQDTSKRANAQKSERKSNGATQPKGMRRSNDSSKKLKMFSSVRNGCGNVKSKFHEMEHMIA